ncbi:ras-related and estrogen-regulated growth inhibitor-like isoform X1 [Branchiostoma floridae]|uniref:Ras-related and estrogen-regulated growth inhibitor n=2 Tax=Branchiostoma floridae TaxID=7739 RepID=A0A9J7L0C1_BRAFL|nr:ras-related and estrogen-regulated growth inhibitor-like isoform X1 [Branchiostoma floridae]
MNNTGKARREEEQHGEGGSKSKMNRRGSDCKATEAKLVVSGKMGVGKSALVVRYLTKRFIWEYDPTLESTYRHQITIEDDVINMEILDTAGQLGEDSTNQWEGHVRWGDGFLLVYSVDDRESFENIAQLKNFLDDIKKPRNVSMVMMANKTDLERERIVSTEEGEKLAQDLACAYYEGSALLGDGVISEALEELCREVRRRKMMEGKQRRRSSSQQVKQVFNRVLTKIYS